MAHGLLRAQFTFGSDSEVRYITTLPVVGDHVTHGSELWRVTSADLDELGLTVVCQRAASIADETVEG